MNEKIKEFRKQACEWARENASIDQYENASDEKFAELIVQEYITKKEIKLWDTQWTNVVNHDNCYRSWSKEDAINHAVKMTEKYISENVANNILPPASGATISAKKPRR